jgi:hypothetical protein
VCFVLIQQTQDIIKSGMSLAILRSDFDRFKNSHADVRRTAGWVNPLEHLAGLVPQALETGIVDFTADPQLVLRTQTSEDTWAAMVQEAEKVMPVYNGSLRIAIEADREASESCLLGWGFWFLILLQSSKVCRRMNDGLSSQRRISSQNIFRVRPLRLPVISANF